jgi:glycosyltransferase involved in cell wall biosynthesis
MRLLFAESSVRGYGTEQHVAALAVAMAQRGHEVRCLVMDRSPVASLLRESQVATRRIAPGPARGARIAAALLALALRQRPDWMISNDPRFYRMLLALRGLSGARVALFRHWHDAPARPATRELLSRRADRFILVSRFHREDYRRQGMDVERASVLYNPIDIERFRPGAAIRASARERLGFGRTDVVIGYVGRMIAAKGIFTLLEAAEPLLAAEGSARLLWVGDGEDAAALRARIGGSAARERHRLLGWQADLAEIYAALDVLAVPSLYPEPFGRVCVEAQAAGIPVVASLAGGLPETFDPGNTGIGIAPGDVGALASALLALARDPQRRQRMGAAGASWAAARFSLARIAEDFEALLARG